MEHGNASGATVLTGDLSFNQSYLGERKDGLESNLRVTTNPGEMVPHFELSFLKSRVVYPKLSLQGETLEQLPYRCPEQLLY